MQYERWLLELWHGHYDVAEEILTPDITGHWRVASWAGTP